MTKIIKESNDLLNSYVPSFDEFRADPDKYLSEIEDSNESSFDDAQSQVDSFENDAQTGDGDVSVQGGSSDDGESFDDSESFGGGFGDDADSSGGFGDDEVEGETFDGETQTQTQVQTQPQTQTQTQSQTQIQTQDESEETQEDIFA